MAGGGLVSTVRTLASPQPPAPIPKGLRPPAQGCEPRATLGKRVREGSTPTGLRQCAGDGGRNPVGVDAQFRSSPRVARGSQPWALRRNPFGIQRGKSACGPRDEHPGRGGLPHEGDLHRGRGTGLVDEVAEGALQAQGFGGEGAGVRGYGGTRRPTRDRRRRINVNSRDLLERYGTPVNAAA